MKALTAAFISVLLLSAVAGVQLLSLGRANPYIRDWKKVGDVAPPDGTFPPTITVFSPKNNSAYASNNISLNFSVSIAKSNNVSLYISEIYYTASWQHDASGQLIKIHVDPGSINLTNIPEGPRWLEIYAIATGFAYESRNELKGIYYTTYYVGYKITSSSTLKFTIDNTAPSILSLSVENKTYATSDVPLILAVNESVSQVTYSLDGQRNVTVAGNTTLTDLPEGAHNVTVYATDEAGNIAVPETMYFSVEVPEPFPTTLTATASGASVVIIGVGLLIYFKKRNNN